MNASNPVLVYWYFHLPNFILAALMYTLLGRAVLALIVEPASSNYIWRFFCRVTDPVVAVVARLTPKAAAPVVVWLFGFVWLFWLRVFLLYVFALAGAKLGGPEGLLAGTALGSVIFGIASVITAYRIVRRSETGAAR